MSPNPRATETSTFDPPASTSTLTPHSDRRGATPTSLATSSDPQRRRGSSDREVQPDEAEHPSKRQRVNTTNLARKKRAPTACQFCRARKAKCDNVRPKCSFCLRHKAKCVYVDGDGFDDENNPEEPVTNRQLLDQLSDIRRMLQLRDVMQQTVPEHHPSPQFTDQIEFHQGYRENARGSFSSLHCESLLRWPALRTVVPAEAAGIESFPLSHGNHESNAQQSQLPEDTMISTIALVSLCRDFLVNVHPRNPVLDGSQLLRYAHHAEANGLGWNSSSCLVLLACSLARYSGMGIKQNDYPHPPTQEQIQQLDTLADKLRAEHYYIAAQKRLGLLGNSLEDIQCFVFATMFEKFFLRPLRAWNYSQQACTRLETHLLQRGERPNVPFKRASPPDSHIEARLFWTCYRAESELCFELGLRPGSLQDFMYPEPLPTPPEWCSPSDSSPETSQDFQQQIEERGWYFYLSEISIRRTVDETLNLLYRNGEAYWLKHPSYLMRQHIECEQQIFQWRHHLPKAVQFPEDAQAEEEFTAALQGRTNYWREYTLRPILYYVLHTPDQHINSEAQRLAQKEIHLCAKVIHRLAYQKRHGGTWLSLRKLFLFASILLSAALNPDRVQPPEAWDILVQSSIQTLRHWGTHASDVRQMADILTHMYHETYNQVHPKS